MTLCTSDCGTVRIRGNSYQRDFQFGFQVLEEADINVYLQSRKTFEYTQLSNPSEWVLMCDNVVRLAEAPSYDYDVVIVRCTPVEPRKATFQKGVAIKADELNDNFTQLAYAIKDVGCAQDNLQNDLGYYWDKSADDTVYEDKPWVTDDDHVATTQAIEQRFWNKLKDVDSTYTDSNWLHHATCRDDYVPTTSAVENRLLDFVMKDDFNVIIDDINIHLDNIDTLMEGFLKLDGSRPMQGILNMDDYRITNVPYPQTSDDAANVQFVVDYVRANGGGGDGDGSPGGGHIVMTEKPLQHTTNLDTNVTTLKFNINSLTNIAQ